MLSKEAIIELLSEDTRATSELPANAVTVTSVADAYGIKRSAARTRVQARVKAGILVHAGYYTSKTPTGASRAPYYVPAPKAQKAPAPRPHRRAKARP